MNEKCFDTGAIQAFLDGELAPAVSADFCDHIAACDACARALAEAEVETAFAFSALEGEFNTLVPTQRLWMKINDSIAEEKQKTSVWTRISAFVSASLMNPSVTIAAGIFVVFGLFAAVLTMRPVSENTTIAINQKPPVSNTVQPPVFDETPEIAAAPSFEEKMPTIQPTAVRQMPRSNDFQKTVVRADFRQTESQRPKTEDRRPIAETALYLPGEESYVKTIATLKQTVDGQKDNTMKPSARISFERDLAVVNDSITKMKQEVRRNPKNETARQILYTSYQNKINLLNSVAERNELMASMQ